MNVSFKSLNITTQMYHRSPNKFECTEMIPALESKGFKVNKSFVTGSDRCPYGVGPFEQYTIKGEEKKEKALSNILKSFGFRVKSTHEKFDNSPFKHDRYERVDNVSDDMNSDWLIKSIKEIED